MQSLDMSPRAPGWEKGRMKSCGSRRDLSSRKRSQSGIFLDHLARETGGAETRVGDHSLTRALAKTSLLFFRLGYKHPHP